MNVFREIEPVEIQCKTSQSIEKFRKKTITLIQNNGGKIKVESNNEIVAGFGSAIKLRLLGAMIAGIKSSPRTLYVLRKQIRIFVHTHDGFAQPPHCLKFLFRVI